MRRVARDEAAVSSVVGTVLVLGITITVFGGLSIYVTDYFGEQQEELRADLGVTESDNAYVVTHRGGESVPLSSARVLANVDGTEVELSAAWLAARVGDTWSTGDLLCVAGGAGSADGCYYPAGTPIEGLFILIGGRLLLSEGERGGEAEETLPIEDPGQPFLDLDNDGLYTEGVDDLLDPSELTDGSFDAGAGGLVIPASVGDISAGTINFQAGGDMRIGVELTTSGVGALTLGVGGDLSFEDSSLTVLHNNAHVNLTIGGSVSAPGITIQATDYIHIDAGGDIDLSNATLTATSNQDDIVLTADGNLTLTDAFLNNSVGNDPITLTAGLALRAERADITSGAALSATAVGIDLDGACLKAASTLTLAAGAGVLSATGPATSGCTTSSWCTAGGFIATGAITLTTAANGVTTNTTMIDLSGSCWHSSSTWTAQTNVASGKGGIDLGNGKFRATTLTATTPTTSDKVEVTGLVAATSVDDGDDRIEVTGAGTASCYPNPPANTVCN